MKAWRKQAANINAQRREESKVGRVATPTAKEQLRQSRINDAWHEAQRWPTLGSFLLAGLLIRAGVSEAITADGAQP